MIRDLLALSGKMDFGAIHHKRSTNQAALDEEEGEGGGVGVFVFSDTIEGPRNSAAKQGRVPDMCTRAQENVCVRAWVTRSKMPVLAGSWHAVQ
jgi:hypothetical protein